MLPFVAAVGRLPRLHPPAQLAGVAGQGLSRGRAGGRLLPRDRRLAARRRPGRWCSGCWPTPGTPRSPSARCRAACAADRQVHDRLALWGRRLLGEAVTQAQQIVAERDELAEFIITGSGDLSGHRRAAATGCSPTTRSGWPSSACAEPIAAPDAVRSAPCSRRVRRRAERPSTLAGADGRRLAWAVDSRVALHMTRRFTGGGQDRHRGERAGARGVQRPDSRTTSRRWSTRRWPARTACSGWSTRRAAGT